MSEEPVGENDPSFEFSNGAWYYLIWEHTAFDHLLINKYKDYEVALGQFYTLKGPSSINVRIIQLVSCKTYTVLEEYRRGGASQLGLDNPKTRRELIEHELILSALAKDS